MLTAIIRAGAGPWALGRTLGPLVPGVVEGLLSDVLIVADGKDEEAATVARASGADLVEAADWPAGFKGAAARGRGSLILVIDAGVLVGETFWTALANRLRRGETDQVLATKAEDAGLLRPVFNRLAGRVSPDQALVLPRALAVGDPWRGSYRGKLVLLQATSLRLSMPGAV